MDGLRSDFSTNKLKYSSYFDPQRSFSNPLRALFEIFSAKPNFSSLIRGGVYDASSDFGRLSQNPVGQQLKTFTDSALYIDYFMESARVLYLRTSFLQRVRKYRTKHFPCCNLFILYLLRFFNPNQIFTLH